MFKTPSLPELEPQQEESIFHQEWKMRRNGRTEGGPAWIGYLSFNQRKEMYILDYMSILK